MPPSFHLLPRALSTVSSRSIYSGPASCEHTSCCQSNLGLYSICLAVRAYKKIVELRHMLEIAESNFKHLGGITEEDLKQKKNQLESEK